ncbi:diguanylate cyclase (GGDEF) domain-containing protein [Gracilibacillus ureilyticus]|uniref:Diguanylate cyclase (GGDEF) domain-containing protein n=1 Tax=Gracilibacillus ureilyticus TaxID=531814 RepID=A0A1H9P1Z8_9BACI|nr:EAL domain-containing protein [Gracilibacillus ureilyticus]SER42256.1 diguanylate cyclase (GGDEF) domain-containing protein [Gracilibacillus ureilyticus]
MNIAHFFHTDHNIFFVVLSFLIAFIASFASIDLAQQIKSTTGFIKHVWLLTGGAVLGIGIWSMHFIAMISYQFAEPVYYDTWIVFYSVIIAIASCIAGFYLITFMKVRIAALFSAGILMGAGIAGMHYIGMEALKLVHITYDPLFVSFSAVIAITASIFALLTGFIIPDVSATVINRRRWGFSILMAVAITSMHYTGMAAATFHYDSSNVLTDNDSLVNIDVFQWFVIIFTFILFFIVFVFIFYQKAIRKTLNLQETLIHSSIVGIVLTDPYNNIIKANLTFKKLVDLLQLTVSNKQLHKNFPFPLDQMESFEVREFEYKKYFIEVSKVLVQLDDEIQYLWYFRNNTEKKEAELLIHKMAYYNQITNLPNRNILEDQMKQWKNEQQSNITCLYVHTHRLRFSAGDSGAFEGDNFIRLIANRIKMECSAQNTIIHYENRSFLVFVLHAKKNDILELAESLLHRLTLPFQMRQGTFSLAVNIGISNYPVHTDRMGTLVYFANLAMLESSQRSKNQYTIFEKSMLENTNRKILLENAMMQAMKDQEFYLVYQPIICVQTGKVASVETLIRWNSKKYGFISPAEFIPIAEETGFINELGAWVVREACLQWGEWKENDQPLTRIAINVSAVQLAHDLFISTVKKILSETEMNAHYLELEITESSSLNYHKSLKDKLDTLSEMGISLSLDDFGTGYSSFEHLKELPVNKLKIDRSFINDLLSDSNQQAILRSIIQLGHNLNMKVLMEGVEQEEQLGWLEQNQCDLIQGYYYSKPLEPKKLTEYVSNQNR